MENIVLKVIEERRSVRSYSEQELSKEQVEQIVRAALRSPSARNLQPWHLTVLQDAELALDWERDIIQYFVDVGEIEVVESNKQRGNKIFYDAPCVFVVSMEPTAGLDVGIMAQSITIAAKSLGLDSVILGFPRVAFDERYHGKWEKSLGFPKDYVFGIAVAVGYGAELGRQRDIDTTKVHYINP